MKFLFSILFLSFCSFGSLHAQNTLYFYESSQPYYELTNFFQNYRQGKLHPVHYANQSWSTSEHAFQAAKFNTPWVKNQIKKSKSAREAFNIAQKNQHLIRSDWLSVRDQVMYQVLKAKFADPHLANVLKKTGSRYLVEASPTDNYWGYGPNKNGQNKLGKILMRIRYEKFGF